MGPALSSASLLSVRFSAHLYKPRLDRLTAVRKIFSEYFRTLLGLLPPLQLKWLLCTHPSSANPDLFIKNCRQHTQKYTHIRIQKETINNWVRGHDCLHLAIQQLHISGDTTDQACKTISCLATHGQQFGDQTHYTPKNTKATIEYARGRQTNPSIHKYKVYKTSSHWQASILKPQGRQVGVWRHTSAINSW